MNNSGSVCVPIKHVHEAEYPSDHWHASVLPCALCMLACSWSAVILTKEVMTISKSGSAEGVSHVHWRRVFGIGAAWFASIPLVCLVSAALLAQGMPWRLCFPARPMFACSQQQGHEVQGPLTLQGIASRLSSASSCQPITKKYAFLKHAAEVAFEVPALSSLRHTCNAALCRASLLHEQHSSSLPMAVSAARIMRRCPDVSASSFVTSESPPSMFGYACAGVYPPSVLPVLGLAEAEAAIASAGNTIQGAFQASLPAQVDFTLVHTSCSELLQATPCMFIQVNHPVSMHPQVDCMREWKLCAY